MTTLLKSSRFYLRLRDAIGDVEVQRAERVIATARVFLGACALLAVYLDPTEPREYAEQAYLLLVAYLLYSLVTLLFLRLHIRSTKAFRFSIHGVDILWASMMTLFTSGPASPFFIFFIFVLLAGAYRWGLSGSLLTATLAISLLFGQAFLTIIPGGIGGYLGVQFSLNRYILTSTYMLIMSVLFGYLAQAEKLMRAEIASIVRIMGNTQKETALNRAIQGITDEVLRIYGAGKAMLAMQELATERVFLWEALPPEGPGESARLHTSEVEAPNRQVYFFPLPAERLGMFAEASDGAAGTYRIFSHNGRTQLNRSLLVSAADAFMAVHPFRSLLCVSGESGEEWLVRFYLLDVRPEACSEEGLRYLESLCSQVSPAVYNIYLLRRIRSRIGALERARIARELHDGPIQSLISLEMQVDVLRRQSGREASGHQEDLTRLQKLLREEVLELRELMQEIKPLEFAPYQLPEFLCDMTERFGRETGIETDFRCGVAGDISLPPRVCREIAQILQEALVNVRKHSGAVKVAVRFGRLDRDWCLEVEDDGRGFEFAGRYSLAQLEAIQKGPSIIKERVRSIRGGLIIESNPGKGARLAMTYSQANYG